MEGPREVENKHRAISTGRETMIGYFIYWGRKGSEHKVGFASGLSLAPTPEPVAPSSREEISS